MQNPILKGFNPDPSICRKGDDYYIATSTFEWFPGVQIFHSKDLVNWKLIKRPLERISQLNMKGNPNSCGIWAPCLSFYDNKFWLIYTDVKSFDGYGKDCHNYLVTCDTIDGEWSDPIFINSSGFDPSLFHDDDGKKYFLNMLWDHRTYGYCHNQFAGIILQEFDENTGKLVGEVKNIFKGTGIKLTEGPHIYKRNGYYYLLTAEGGTMYEHSVTIARSKNIWGPYDLHPENPILTAVHSPENALQKSGHASMVETPEGEWFMVHLTGRPLTERGNCPLGRETAIQKIYWEEDWPFVVGGKLPSQSIESLEHIPQIGDNSQIDDFDSQEIDINFQALRIPMDGEIMSLTERPGHLRIFGRESLKSMHTQATIARRWQSFQFTAKTCLEFNPYNYQQMAGLVNYYNTNNWYYLYITYNEEIDGRVIEVVSSVNSKIKFHTLGANISIPKTAEKIYLKCEVNYEKLNYFYSFDEIKWIKIGPTFDSNVLSDDYIAKNSSDGFFTGAFVGMNCQDLSGNKLHADFDYFHYLETK
ncbi:MAG: glycoside hydrolase family 43 protein [Fusobacteriaceae bacterium]